jgi:hypothetical protein
MENRHESMVSRMAIGNAVYRTGATDAAETESGAPDMAAH